MADQCVRACVCVCIDVFYIKHSEKNLYFTFATPLPIEEHPQSPTAVSFQSQEITTGMCKSYHPMPGTRGF